MENTNDNRYLFHREFIIVAIGIALLVFGFYKTTYGQIYPSKDRATDGELEAYGPINKGKPIINDSKSNINDPTNGGAAVHGPDPVIVVVDGVKYYPTGSVPVTNNGPWTYYDPTQWRWVPPTNTGSGTGSSGYWQTVGGNFTTPGTYQPIYLPSTNSTNNTGGSYLQGQNYIIKGSYDPAYRLSPTNNNMGNSYLQNQTYTIPESNDPAITPSSISAPTSENVNFKNCAAFTKYHAFGDKGGDIMTIQMFLKEKGYYKGVISGVYGITTFKAVQAFQKDYSDQILNPWGIGKKEATGKWYKSTRKKANQIIGCPEPAVYLERVNKLLEY